MQISFIFDEDAFSDRNTNVKRCCCEIQKTIHRALIRLKNSKWRSSGCDLLITIHDDSSFDFIFNESVLKQAQYTVKRAISLEW